MWPLLHFHYSILLIASIADPSHWHQYSRPVLLNATSGQCAWTVLPARGHPTLSPIVRTYISTVGLRAITHETHTKFLFLVRSSCVSCIERGDIDGLSWTCWIVDFASILGISGAEEGRLEADGVVLLSWIFGSCFALIAGNNFGSELMAIFCLIILWLAGLDNMRSNTNSAPCPTRAKSLKRRYCDMTRGVTMQYSELEWEFRPRSLRHNWAHATARTCALRSRASTRAMYMIFINNEQAYQCGLYILIFRVVVLGE